MMMLSSLQCEIVLRSDIGPDHHLLMSSLPLCLKKREQVGQCTKTYAVDRLRDPAIAKQYKIEMKSYFQLLENKGGIKCQSTRF